MQIQRRDFEDLFRDVMLKLKPVVWDLCDEKGRLYHKGEAYIWRTIKHAIIDKFRGKPGYSAMLKRLKAKRTPPRRK